MQKYRLKKIIILLSFPLVFGLGQISENDSTTVKKNLIGYDKVQHTAVSCLLTVSGQYIFESKLNLDKNDVILYSASSAAAIGLSKELNDMNRRVQPFDWGDMLANIIGIGLGVLIIGLSI